MARRGFSGFTSGPRKVRLAGVEWVEHYNCYRATVGGWLDLYFSYGDIADRRVTGYAVSVAGVRLKTTQETREQAAQYAIDAARVILKRAMDALPQGAAMKEERGV